MRGRNVMMGYNNLPEANSEAFDNDGWLRSGDVGAEDDEGYVLYLVRYYVCTSGDGDRDGNPLGSKGNYWTMTCSPQDLLRETRCVYKGSSEKRGSRRRL